MARPGRHNRSGGLMKQIHRSHELQLLLLRCSVSFEQSQEGDRRLATGQTPLDDLLHSLEQSFHLRDVGVRQNHPLVQALP